MNNKKAFEGGIWWIIIGAVVALIVAGMVLFIVGGGLSTGKQNVDLLASCRNQGGTCKETCVRDETGFYKSGNCPDDPAGNNEYCCIPKNK